MSVCVQPVGADGGLEVDRLINAIRRREARCGVVGLGYVGLPLALEFARAGFRTIGIDVDPTKVAAVNAGRSYIVDIQDAELAAEVQGGRLAATSDFATIAALDRSEERRVGKERTTGQA